MLKDSANKVLLAKVYNGHVDCMVLLAKFGFLQLYYSLQHWFYNYSEEHSSVTCTHKEL